MTYVHRQPVRFDDVDFARIVYFPRLFGYCHAAFEDFFANETGKPYTHWLSARKTGFPTVHAEADFRAPFQFGDVCRIEMDTLRVGKSSLSNRYRLYRGREKTLRAEIQIITAAVDIDSIHTVALPSEVREAFARHSVKAPSKKR